ncbi:MAG TPA: hypothetical protein VF033_15105 [Steroidobacteraceae bacterium]|jgi:hypothetical protein
MNERHAGHPRRRDCPGCAAPTVALPWFTTRRRSPIACTNCGTRLERVLPGVPYYTLSFVIAMLAEAAVPTVLLLAFFRQVGWIAVIVVSLVAVNLAGSAWLNRRTRVEFADPKDARKDRPGRWYPDVPD